MKLLRPVVTKLIFLILFVALPGGVSWAQQYVGILASEFNTVAASKQVNEWCWAASTQRGRS